jgi:two-component system nitrogen regulation sensor histidine kinase NtrY
MSLRTRLLLAFAAIVVIPIALLAFGLRQDMTRRLSQEYQLRVNSVVEVIRDDLTRESAGIAERLAAIERAVRDDNRFRLAAVAGVESERDYLLDYAGTAMRLTGLSMLQVYDGEGRIISSGHFRNEHGRVDAEFLAALAHASGAVVLANVRAVDGEFLALVRNESFAIAGRPFTMVGGVQVDDAFVARLARDRTIGISLTFPEGTLASGPIRSSWTTLPGDARNANDVAIGELEIPLIRTTAGERVDVTTARLQVAQPLTALRLLLRGADTWLLMTAVGSGLVALLLGVWVSSRISRPLAALAEKTAVLDLDRLDVDFEAGNDEVGVLSRLLGDLAARLRTSTARVREAERRATVGDLARQINHDIKNGLIPLRNVMRHLGQVSGDEPGALPSVFAERRQTIDSSLTYLETLATSYQRLSRPLEWRECDLNDLVADIVRAAQRNDHVEFDAELTPHLPRVVGDRIAFRRILENLMANAVDSLQSKPGRITVATQLVERPGESPVVRVTVADTGRGMSSDEAGLIFNDFYTTKEGGTGLGLSIVRRLVMDLHGTIGVDSAPGKGTRIRIDIPASGPART